MHRSPRWSGASRAGVDWPAKEAASRTWPSASPARSDSPCKQRGDGSLIIVAANRQPLAALRDYKKRWQIECLFGDTKTRGLNMEDTRLTQPAKLGLLTAIVALALAWAHACASTIRGKADIARPCMNGVQHT